MNPFLSGLQSAVLTGLFHVQQIELLVMVAYITHISPMIEMEVLEVLLTQLEWTFYRYLDVDRVAEMKDIPIHTSSWRDCIVKILTRSKRSSGCRVWPPECCYKMGIHI